MYESEALKNANEDIETSATPHPHHTTPTHNLHVCCDALSLHKKAEIHPPQLHVFTLYKTTLKHGLHPLHIPRDRECVRESKGDIKGETEEDLRHKDDTETHTHTHIYIYIFVHIEKTSYFIPHPFHLLLFVSMQTSPSQGSLILPLFSTYFERISCSTYIRQ